MEGYLKQIQPHSSRSKLGMATTGKPELMNDAVAARQAEAADSARKETSWVASKEEEFKY